MYRFNADSAWDTASSKVDSVEVEVLAGFEGPPNGASVPRDTLGVETVSSSSEGQPAVSPATETDHSGHRHGGDGDSASVHAGGVHVSLRSSKTVRTASTTPTSRPIAPTIAIIPPIVPPTTKPSTQMTSPTIAAHCAGSSPGLRRGDDYTSVHVPGRPGVYCSDQTVAEQISSQLPTTGIHLQVRWGRQRARTVR